MDEEPETGNPLYTSAEIAWMKRAFGGENKLLDAHGLNAMMRTDRAKGRLIAREIIEKEAKAALAESNDEEGEAGADESEEEENGFLADLEADPMSHLADSFFSEEQLDWIKQHYRHSGNFFLTHGLKPFEDEDCEEGVAIVEAFMQEDEETD